MHIYIYTHIYAYILYTHIVYIYIYIYIYIYVYCYSIVYCTMILQGLRQVPPRRLRLARGLPGAQSIAIIAMKIIVLIVFAIRVVVLLLLLLLLLLLVTMIGFCGWGPARGPGRSQEPDWLRGGEAHPVCFVVTIL